MGGSAVLDKVSPWLTRIEAAEYARVTPGTIDRWARNGDLKRFYPRGTRSVRFHRDQLDGLMIPATESVEVPA